MGLFYTPLILSKAMQSLVINTRTGPITVKLFVTLHYLTQERGKGCTGWVTAPPHQAFPGIPTPLHHRFHNTLSHQHVLILTSRLLLVLTQGAKANPCLSPDRRAVHRASGLNVFARPGVTALNVRRLPPAASKARGKQSCFTPRSQHPTARYYLNQSYSDDNLRFITDVSIPNLPGFQQCTWCISTKSGNQN